MSCVTPVIWTTQGNTGHSWSKNFPTLNAMKQPWKSLGVTYRCGSADEAEFSNAPPCINRSGFTYSFPNRIFILSNDAIICDVHWPWTSPTALLKLVNNPHYSALLCPTLDVHGVSKIVHYEGLKVTTRLSPESLVHQVKSGRSTFIKTGQSSGINIL